MEFFVLNFNTLDEIAQKLNDKLDYFDEGIDIIVQELEYKKDDISFYNFLCKGKY